MGTAKVFSALVQSELLFNHLQRSDWVVIDCRFSLANPNRGHQDYLEAHIPGAVYAHLEHDLCAPVVPGVTGRHPLPEAEFLADKFSAWGIGPGVQVVAYDDSQGSMAARLWWSLRWLGHEAAAVLDGGWQSWIAASHPVQAGEERRGAAAFHLWPNPDWLVSTEQVLKHLEDPDWKIVDSRAPARYRGDAEPIDPVAGRIPGAINAPHEDVIGTDGQFLPASQLRARFLELLADTPSDQIAFYCGSGVTAARNVLAMAHAGLKPARLYVGSWSEWITSPTRPIESG